MAQYTIQDDGGTVAVDVTQVAGQQEQLVTAFGECQAGHCSCPTDEYQKLASMEIDQTDDGLRLQLQARPGERFDTSEIAACLDYTTARVNRGGA